MLQVDEIHTYYGNIQAVKGISFVIREGEIVTLIGANGAGKSTTLMSVAGITPPRAGTIRFMDKDITGMEPDKIVALGISKVPEGRRIFPYLSVQENLDLGAFLRRDKPGIQKDLEYIFSLFPVLKQRRTQS
jgi:branched-chain amino acid transport system ATP-binding protein